MSKPGKELYVGSLSFDVTEYDLEKLFAVSGTVTSVHLICDNKTGEFKGCGYVRMSTEAEAKDAIQSLDRAMLIDRRITVSLANPQKPKTAGGGYKGKNPNPAFPGASPARKAAGGKASTAKPASAKPAGPKTGAARPAAAKSADAKSSFAGQDAPKSGFSKSGTSKPSFSRSDSAKTGFAKADSDKGGFARRDSGKTGFSKPGAAKTGSSRPSSSKPGPTRTGKR